MLVNANPAKNRKFILALTLCILAASFFGSYNEANGNLLLVVISLLVPLSVTNIVSHIFGPRGLVVIDCLLASASQAPASFLGLIFDRLLTVVTRIAYCL